MKMSAAEKEREFVVNILLGQILQSIAVIFIASVRGCEYQHICVMIRKNVING